MISDVKEHGVLRHLSRYTEVAKLDDSLVVQQQIHGPWPMNSQQFLGGLHGKKMVVFKEFYMI